MINDNQPVIVFRLQLNSLELREVHPFGFCVFFFVCSFLLFLFSFVFVEATVVSGPKTYQQAAKVFFFCRVASNLKMGEE